MSALKRRIRTVMDRFFGKHKTEQKSSLDAKTSKVNSRAREIQMSSEELVSFGYGIGQWLVDNGHTKIIVYSRKNYIRFFRLIIFQLKATRGLFIEGFCGKENFSLKFLQSRRFKPVRFRKLNPETLKPGCTVLGILPEKADSELLEAIRSVGGTYLDLSTVDAAARKYLYFTRPALVYLRGKVDYELKVATYELPVFPDHSLSKAEELLVKTDLGHKSIRKIISEKQPLPEAMRNREIFDCDPEIFPKLIEVPSSSCNENGIRRYGDKDDYVGIADGHRKTANQPNDAERTIFMVGGCRTFGVGVLDGQTIPSGLQMHINEKEEESYTVENHGYFLVGRREDQYMALYDLSISKGDIILIQAPRSEFFPHIDLSKLFERPHDYGEVFYNKGAHYNINGNKHAAEALYAALKKENFFADYQKYWDKQAKVELGQPRVYGAPNTSIASEGSQNSIGSAYRKELLTYQDMLHAARVQAEGSTGAIVMNCNPFTLGHRYLIEAAAAKVRHLYIFAVEEDKSVFPFADRIELIRKGTADLPNVTVLPSGQFIISSLTFSSYFNKAEIQDQTIDPSQDVELFAQEIAPALGINIRFAGEEPLDLVTQQYNDAMARILPRYNIAFDVIPRKEEGGDPISASRVRKLLDEKDWEGIARLVPQTTLEYLQDKWR